MVEPLYEMHMFIR